MTSKTVIQNTKYLRSIARGADDDVRDRVNQLIDFYKDRKISQMTTAENLIKRLTSDNKRTVTFAKKKFDKKFEEIEGRDALNQRMARNRNKKDYAITFQVYGLDNGVKASGSRGFKDHQGDWHNLLIHRPINFTIKNVRDDDKLPETLVDKYVVRDKFDNWVDMLKMKLKLRKSNPNHITKKRFDELNNREAWIKETGVDVTPPKRRKDIKGRYKEFDVIHDTALFEKLLKILVSKNPEFKGTLVEDYGSAIKILDISDVTNTGGGESETRKKLKDGGAIGIYNYTIDTELDVDAEYFVEAIQDQTHTDGECWINTLADHYKDTLMSENKWKSKRMTREKIFELMNVTEEEFRTTGASVEDMVSVFKEFKLTVRLYNCLGRKVFSYDPEKKNKNVSALYGLIKGNHIYTMNDNIMSISQRHMEEDLRLCASTDFRLNSQEKPIKYEMFKSIDDTMKIVKENDDEKEINLVNHDCLNNIYCDYKKAGYEPKIIMGAGGSISSLKLKFNGVTLNIRSQSLIDCAVENHITSDTTEMFNKVNEAMFHFNKGLFNPYHKSYYHEDDLKIFSKTHTVASSGYLSPIGTEKDKIEIDKTKAYTKSAMEIVRVPVFSRFDIWKKYDYDKNDFNKMSKYTLYYVKSRVKNMFFNKSHNLIYGKFLKYYSDVVEIIYYKTPSNIKKVNYKQLIKDLWDNKFDEDETKDKAIKKMIGNINFGLLEKQTNTVRKSFVFDKMIDAFYYQEMYNGNINVITQHERENEEDENGMCRIVSSEKHYVLNI